MYAVSNSLRRRPSLCCPQIIRTGRVSATSSRVTMASVSSYTGCVMETMTAETALTRPSDSTVVTCCSPPKTCSPGWRWHRHQSSIFVFFSFRHWFCFTAISTTRLPLLHLSLSFPPPLQPHPFFLILQSQLRMMKKIIKVWVLIKHTVS